MFEKKLMNVTDKIYENKEVLLKEMVESVKNYKFTDAGDAYYEAVINREKQTSTSIGYGIAIPHGESNSVRKTFVSCYKLEKPLTWTDYEGTETVVTLVFLIGVPKDERSKEHLRILALLSRNLMHENFLRKLNSAATKEELFEYLKQINSSEE